MPPPVRRMAPGQAAARAASAAPAPAPVAPARRSTPPPRQVEHVGEARVSVSVKDRQSTYHSEEKEEEVLIQRFAEDNPPARIRVAAGVTRSLGAGTFEFLRIDVAVELPVDRTRLDDAYAIATEWVANKMEEEEANWVTPTPNGKAR